MRKVWLIIANGEATTPRLAFGSKAAAETARKMLRIPTAYEVKGVPLVTGRPCDKLPYADGQNP